MMAKSKNVLRALATVLAVVVVFFLSSGDAAWAKKRVPVSKAQVQLSFAPLVKATAPAVVNIYTRKVVRTRQFSPLFNDPFFRRFFGEGFGVPQGRARKRVQNSLGSGVIVSADGRIVTNHHVIKGADEITVALSDRREFEAKVIGTDERTDLAILQLQTGGEKLPFLAFRDSDELEVGDLVLAIGNPFGVGQTVTSGIVSALARTQVGISDLNFFIQTDAAINPGNSGGALVTMDGRLVGINSAIFSKSGGSHGIGFAIPSNMVRSVLSGVSENGRLVRPWLGAWGQKVTAEIAMSLGMHRPTGVLLNRIYRRGPADRAGLRVGDILLTVKGRAVEDPQALMYRVATLPVGDKVKLTYWRKGKEHKARLRLVAPPEDPLRNMTDLSGPHPLSGITVANMSPALADELGFEAFEPGVIILRLRRGANAARLGFQPGDTILKINKDDVKTVRGLDRILAKPVERWRIAIKRNGKTLQLVINR
jgi:Do/DeqQ family serine protease